MDIICPKCRNERSFPDGKPLDTCPNCGVIYAKAEAALNKNREQLVAGQAKGSDPAPKKEKAVNVYYDAPSSFLSTTLFALAILSLLGSFIIGYSLWPGDPGYGKEWKGIAYIPSLTWFVAGVVEASIFAALGQGLKYLHGIFQNSVISGE